MTDFWTVGPTRAVIGLRALGFTPQEAERLVALKLRHERAGFRELTQERKRRLFARRLVAHGRLSDWPMARREASQRKSA